MFTWILAITPIMKQHIGCGNAKIAIGRRRLASKIENSLDMKCIILIAMRETAGTAFVATVRKMCSRNATMNTHILLRFL